ncbi:hypothetical protein FJT64_017798 [Amphibalanus amphitrite]|uniref:Mab-21-like HhH/H2TH-like domain-containing protein n=1 Tax=Amphibalanus amphitrite TaxID=1232801 RepID=A0A6A4WZG4_AMPAM|nr:hypothetical protein FJT64_017798 [Amphibalanus amphitrite]
MGGLASLLRQLRDRLLGRWKNNGGLRDEEREESADRQEGAEEEDEDRGHLPEDRRRGRSTEDGIERPTVPPGSETWFALAEQLQTRCGDLTSIVFNSLALCDTADSAVPNFVLSVRHGHVQRVHMARRAPLLEALQRACAGCRPVPDAPPLTVLSCALSGSGLERFHDLTVGQRGTSDLDIMHRLGPARCRLAEGRWPNGTPPPTSEADRDAPLLTVEPSEAPGFALVRSAATGALVSAARVRRLMFAAVLLDSADGTEVGCSGPSAAVSPPPDQVPNGLDNVPCLRLRQWPSDEFFRRHRPQDWPPPAARRDILQFGVHLVPVGSKFGALSEDEWRLSLSRAEVVAAWHLPNLYRAALIAVKNAKNLLGDEGKGLKSYYVKTTVFWMREQFAADQWQNVTEAVLVLLERLDSAAAAGSLPCYFWSEIDLFRFLNGAELAALRRTVALLRARLGSLLTVWSAYYCSPALRPLLETDLSEAPLPEVQVRTRLARGLVVWAIVSGLHFRPAAPVHDSWCAGRVPDLLRRAAVPELLWLHLLMTSQCRMQQYLLAALLVAPDQLVAGARLTPLPGGLLALDAAPLMALLTPSDLQRLLVDPAAVGAWCRHQLSLPPEQRPAGLTAAPDTPRGLAELLLNSALLARALSESVPGWSEAARLDDEKRQRMWSRTALRLETYSGCRAALEELLASDLEGRLRSRPAAAAAAAAAAAGPSGDPAAEMAAALLEDLSAASPSTVARLWREAISRQLADPELRRRVTEIGSTLHDPWKLRQYVIAEPQSGDDGRQGQRNDGQGDEDQDEDDEHEARQDDGGEDDLLSVE